MNSTLFIIYMHHMPYCQTYLQTNFNNIWCVPQSQLFNKIFYFQSLFIESMSYMFNVLAVAFDTQQFRDADSQHNDHPTGFASTGQPLKSAPHRAMVRPQHIRSSFCTFRDVMKIIKTMTGKPGRRKEGGNDDTMRDGKVYCGATASPPTTTLSII